MKKIYIDPGHGGADSGAEAFGIKEKEQVLKVGLFLAEALERNGYDVMMSRRADAKKNLADRCKEANTWGAEAVVSLHMNWSESSAAKGTETYIVARGGKAEKLAESVHKELVRELVLVDRKVKEASFVILKNTEAPAVLCELGFLTNAEECAFLTKESTHRRAAEAICRGICRFDGKEYKAMEKPRYKDEKDIPAWAKDAVERVAEAGLMLGHDDGTFKPNEPLTRAQMAVILDRLEMLGEK